MYYYHFPYFSGKPDTQPVIDALQMRVADERQTCLVHLFMAPGSKNEYLGEWVGVEVRQRDSTSATLVLKRMANQDPKWEREYTDVRIVQARSRNEMAHMQLLCEMFGEEDWVVTHEPFTVLDLHQPKVVAGKYSGGCDASSYTTDFVVYNRHTCERICVESKPCSSHVNDEALFKCRQLRDKTLSRVVFMVGSGREEPRWLDMGSPHSAELDEVWHPCFSTLTIALGV